MSIYDLKIGDELEIIIDLRGRDGKSCKGDILKITSIKPDIYSTLWITHENPSFSGGGFRISDDNAFGYKLYRNFNILKEKNKDNYKYLIQLLKKLKIK